jgi:hypothetical protein
MLSFGMSDAFEGISTKLDRADEHIGQFDVESKAFLNEGANARLLYNDPKAKEAFEQFHAARQIPLRLSILVGEAVYHLRSALDHVACALILKNNGTITNESQFPIERFKPTTPKDLRRYERKVHGIAAEPLALIERAQPYRVLQARDRHWLAILKRLNNFDKHQALVLHVVRFRSGTHFTIRDAQDSAEGQMTMTYADGRTRLVDVVNVQSQIAPFIAFGNITKRPDVEVLSILTPLAIITRKVVMSLRPFL